MLPSTRAVRSLRQRERQEGGCEGGSREVKAEHVSLQPYTCNQHTNQCNLGEHQCDPRYHHHHNLHIYQGTGMALHLNSWKVVNGTS